MPPEGTAVGLGLLVPRFQAWSLGALAGGTRRCPCPEAGRGQASRVRPCLGGAPAPREEGPPQMVPEARLPPWGPPNSPGRAVPGPCTRQWHSQQGEVLGSWEPGPASSDLRDSAGHSLASATSVITGVCRG